MAIPPRYLKAPEGVITSFNFADVISGTGYLTLYGFDTDLDEFELSPQQLYSSLVETTRTTTGTTERNFDITFNTPINVNGKMFVVCTFGGNSSSGTTNTFVLIRIIHVDRNAVETTIGTQVTSDTHSNTTSTVLRVRRSFIFDVNKVFRKNEKLRVEVILDASIGTGTSGFYHDGAGRDMNAFLTTPTSNDEPAETTFIVHVPLKVEA